MQCTKRHRVDQIKPRFLHQNETESHVSINRKIGIHFDGVMS